MEEYIIKTATAAEWQKWLNQWRHGYKLRIEAVSETDGRITIVLVRKSVSNGAEDVVQAIDTSLPSMNEYDAADQAGQTHEHDMNHDEDPGQPW